MESLKLVGKDIAQKGVAISTGVRGDKVLLHFGMDITFVLLTTEQADLIGRDLIRRAAHLRGQEVEIGITPKRSSPIIMPTKTH